MSQPALRFALAFALTAALGACSAPTLDEQQQAAAQSEQRAQQDATPASESPAPADASACDASQAQWLIGKAPAPADLEQAQKDAGARSVRTLKPDQAVTLEFVQDRLNAEVDEKGVVASVRCG